MRNSLEVDIHDLRMIEQHNLVTLFDIYVTGDADIVSLRREFDGTATVIYLLDNEIKTFNLTEGRER